tara:strand:- start:15 stop:431 length:417 start_codon:yes stop_codon:yes gene_type:complete
MPSTHTITRRVEFSETDQAGIVHYSNFFRYMEACEHDFFRSLGTSIVDKTSGVGWPRVHATCEYRKPLFFEDEFTITLRVTGKTSKSISYEFFFTKDGDEIANGGLTICCVRRDDTGAMKATDIPTDLAAKIEVAADN